MMNDRQLPERNSADDPAQDGKVHTVLYVMETSFVYDPRGCSVLIAPGGYGEPYVARWMQAKDWDSVHMHDDEHVETTLRAAVREWEERPYVTKTGHVITEDEIDTWVNEAEAGYDVSELKDRPNRREMPPALTGSVRTTLIPELGEHAGIITGAELNDGEEPHEVNVDPPIPFKDGDGITVYRGDDGNIVVAVVIAPS